MKKLAKTVICTVYRICVVLGQRANLSAAHGVKRETIDSELRLLAAVRRSIREHGGEPSSRQVDEWLDERLSHAAGPVRTRQSTRSGGRTPSRRIGTKVITRRLAVSSP
jgi:hypothetical protein